LSDSFTKPSQTSHANISSWGSEVVGRNPDEDPTTCSIAPSFDLNKFISTTKSRPFRAISVVIACSNA
jgi:hypothetical protein